MSNSVMRFLVKSMGFCCPARYIRSTEGIPTDQMEKHLGLHRRTIRYWRQWLREGKIKCEHCHNCQGVKDSST